MMTKDIENVLMRGSIAELRALYVERRLSVTDAVNWYLSRINDISQKGPAINAVREVSLRAIDDAKRADVAIASGEDLQALHGIPVLLKDNILTGDGMKVAAGAAALRDFQPDDDATLVKCLRSAGAIVLGKTNLTEFADFVSDVMPSGHRGNGGVVNNTHGIEYVRGQVTSFGYAAALAAVTALVDTEDPPLEPPATELAWFPPPPPPPTAVIVEEVTAELFKVRVVLLPLAPAVPLQQVDALAPAPPPPTETAIELPSTTPTFSK